MNQQQVQQLFANTTNCPQCHKCFCSTAKMQAIDGSAICAFCKPAYEERLRSQNRVPPPNQMYPR